MFACVCVCETSWCVFIAEIRFRDKRTNNQQEVTQHTQPEPNSSVRLRVNDVIGFPRVFVFACSLVNVHVYLCMDKCSLYDSRYSDKVEICFSHLHFRMYAVLFHLYSLHACAVCQVS